MIVFYNCVLNVKIFFFFLICRCGGISGIFLNKLILAYNFNNYMGCTWQYGYEFFKLSKYLLNPNICICLQNISQNGKFKKMSTLGPKIIFFCNYTNALVNQLNQSFFSYPAHFFSFAFFLLVQFSFSLQYLVKFRRKHFGCSIRIK